ncbi:MAG: hypothetical protein JXR96_30425 [Deltaproteobacteria bacterium]|nr:hypothetical protein [Deltaproteobacteria bacterium]
MLSGAHRGAEAAFGACAERWGIAERNFTFAGRPVARSRGLVLLDERELEQGDVSWAYLDDRMHRDYPRTDAFRKVLQSIWHQVNPAGEVFAVGKIKKDGTVKGGTGWAVELAKRLGKPVCVFDQEQQRWFFWESSWQPTEPPRIQRPAFCGTGTARLSEPGEQAIRELFERSFGSPEAHD